jgi:hypothetical protein
MQQGASCRAVGSSKMPQVRRSWVWSLWRSLDFSVSAILLAALRSIQPLTGISTSTDCPGMWESRRFRILWASITRCRDSFSCQRTVYSKCRWILHRRWNILKHIPMQFVHTQSSTKVSQHKKWNVRMWICHSICRAASQRCHLCTERGITHIEDFL